MAMDGGKVGSLNVQVKNYLMPHSKSSAQKSPVLQFRKERLSCALHVLTDSVRQSYVMLCGKNMLGSSQSM